MMLASKRTLVATLLVVFLTTVGFCLRIRNLGSVEFNVDEFYTTYAALGILREGRPILPSGIEYWRSYPNTLCITLAMRLMGVSEFSARLPSVVFGCATIVVVYLLGKKLYGELAGILSAAMLALSWWAVLWSQMARMYSQLALLYTMALYSVYLLLEKRTVGWLATSCLLVFLAVLTHRLAVLLPLGIVVFQVYEARGTLIEKLRRRSSLLLVSTLLVASILLYSAFPHFFTFEAPPWDIRDIRTYYWHFKQEQNAVVVLLAILSLLWVTMSRTMSRKLSRPTAYLAANLVVPGLVLLIYPWRDPRYALHLLPVLITLASGFASWMVQNGLSWMNRHRAMALVLIGTSGILVFEALNPIYSINATDPARRTGESPFFIRQSGWRQASEFLRQLDPGKNLSIMSTLSIASLHYLGRVDYHLGAMQATEGRAVNNESGLRNPYTGVAMITESQQLIDLLEGGKGVALLADGWLHKYVDKDLADIVEAEMILVFTDSRNTAFVFTRTTR